MSAVSVDHVTSILAEVAAREIMPRYRKLAHGDIIMKGVDDPVTVADRVAEAVLTHRLTAMLPGSVVVGEEGFAHDPGIFAHFATDKDVWVIDPIDGTRNFIAGSPEFAVMVALVRRKQTIGAWIHDPNTGDTLSAELGGGVWLGKTKMRLAGKDDARAPLAIIGSRLKGMLSRDELAVIMGVLPELVRASASSFDYARLFTGPKNFARSDASRVAYLLYRQTKPWDHLPGLLMVNEAAGYAATSDGYPYSVDSGHKGLLIAPDAAKWHRYAKDFNRALDSLSDE